MEVAPHYLRFARALTLASVAATPSCYRAHERPSDAVVVPLDAFSPDVGPCARPLPCTCPSLGSPGSCSGPYAMCCPIVGPLAPPEVNRPALSSTRSRA